METQISTPRTDEVVRLLQKSSRTFDAICILDWYDGIIQGIVLKNGIPLALLLTARYSCYLGYLFEVAEIPHAETLSQLRQSCREEAVPSGDKHFLCRGEGQELERLIQKAQSLDFLLEAGSFDRLGSRFAIKQVWGSRVPWYAYG